ncbi:class I SAM-dependent methyltransferase [Pseudonocardia nigra]|uniref:class I SAM-dependent methyltransferase n=1 Tax=Pseudonocardia nigra TaxID=1921578 RepID=UPI001C5ECF9A|nr:class I SAM-dependent methyltransferase [Pseudonocardia nigra]
MTSTSVARDADRALKAKHRALWAAGDYPRVAAELIPSFGPELVRACAVHAGQRVLDVGAGSGNAAIPAAALGAAVVASDLTPELFTAGRRIAAERGVQLEWAEADAEALPFADDAFDVVMSSVGAMFAPRHQVVADELVRVARPGGTIGMINWTPDGFIGHLFRTMAPYAPPPPPGAGPPPLWGDEQHVRVLFGDRVTGLDLRRQSIQMTHPGDPAAFREYWKRHYGPTIAVYRFNAADPDRLAALDRDFLQFLTNWNHGSGGESGYEAEYLLMTARKRVT